jgi:DNA invertase Pin-like site-specific DNA recombinase
MKYVVSDVIKRLTEAQKEGKTLITESELIQAATPVINNIDEVIHLIDKGIEKLEHKKWYFPVTFTDAAKLTGISRQTLYRWCKKDILELGTGNYRIDLHKLKKNILSIKKIHGTHE